jgi:hypothetical protein
MSSRRKNSQVSNVYLVYFMLLSSVVFVFLPTQIRYRFSIEKTKLMHLFLGGVAALSSCPTAYT